MHVHGPAGKLLGPVLGVPDLEELLQPPRFQTGEFQVGLMFDKWHLGIEKPPCGGM